MGVTQFKARPQAPSQGRAAPQRADGLSASPGPDPGCVAQGRSQKLPASWENRDNRPGPFPGVAGSTETLAAQRRAQKYGASPTAA